MKKLLYTSLFGMLSIAAISHLSAFGGGCCPVQQQECAAPCGAGFAAPAPAKPNCYKTVMVPKQIMVPKVVQVPAIEKRIKQAPTCERVPEYYKVPITVYETRCRYKTIWHAQPDIVCYECPVDTSSCPAPACPVAC